jgi:hypothetical protein
MGFDITLPEKPHKYDPEILPVIHNRLQDRSHLDHPGYGSQEVAQQFEQGIDLRFGDFIVALMLQSFFSL